MRRFKKVIILDYTLEYEYTSKISIFLLYELQFLLILTNLKLSNKKISSKLMVKHNRDIIGGYQAPHVPGHIFQDLYVVFDYLSEFLPDN